MDMDLDHDCRVWAAGARPVVYAARTVSPLATVFVEESIGAALVRSPHGTIGLVSERDIVRAIADGAKSEIHNRVRDHERGSGDGRTERRRAGSCEPNA
jgi:hypothetical protein